MRISGLPSNGHAVGFTPIEEFPIAAFPPWARDYVIALSYVLQVEPCVIALSVLGATAMAVQSKADLAVRGGWVEPLSFWTLVTLRSGNRKTPALLRPIGPLRAYEREQNEARASYRDRLREKRSDKKAAGGKREASAPGDPCPFREAEPPDLELFGSDLTPEAVAMALAEQNEAYAILTDEPTSLAEVLGGMYSDKGKANTGIYMAGYSGSAYRRRRVKGNNAKLERPALSMVLIGQPSVFEDLTARSALVDLGFVGRLLVCRPLDHLGEREIHDQSVPPAVEGAYAAGFRAILAAPFLEPLPDVLAAWIPDPPPKWPSGSRPRHRLSLSGDARELHAITEAEIEPLLAAQGALGELSDFGAKLSGLIARAAALLHVLHRPQAWIDAEVGLEHMGHAIEIGRYALGEVLRIWSAQAVDREQEQVADYVLRRGAAIADPSGHVTWRALSRALVQSNGRGRIQSPQVLQDALEVLVARGHLSVAVGQHGGRSWLVDLDPDA